MMKSSKWEHLGKSANMGLRVAKGERFSTVIRKKNSKCKRDGLVVYTTQEWWVSIYSAEWTKASPSGTTLWFSVKGFVTVITAFLGTIHFVLFDHIRRKMAVKCKLVGEYLNKWALAAKTCVCTSERVGAQRWLILAGVCWLIECPGLWLSDHLWSLCLCLPAPTERLGVFMCAFICHV